MRVRRRLAATALSGLVALTAALSTACDDSSGAEDPAASSSSAAASSGSPAVSSGTPSVSRTSASASSSATADETSSAGPSLDPEHAVDPPGRRTGRWAPPDILVTGSRTIPVERVRAIRRLRGVLDVEQIALAQVPIENRALTVAAVDPASYRNYVTDLRSAQEQAVWDRVAGGELALQPGLRKKLPLDRDGFVALGSTEDAPDVHLGAIAPQTWQVDAVLNRTWISSLKMVRGNALLIRTGDTAPDRLRKPIERVLRGSRASVQMTDAVARYGLDVNAVQTAVVVGTVADAVGTFHYSVLSGGRIAPDPAWVRAHITTEVVPILGAVTCNKLLFPQLKGALQEVQARGLADKIHPGEYAGCYYPRFIAGTTTLSNHAFGLALDLNTPGNQRGTVGEMDRTVVSIFKEWGFAWGGDWHYTDPMHFEMSRLVRPG